MSPKHKTPWITYNGEVVSDSQFIIEYLNKKFNLDLNSHLSEEQRGVARAMQKMIEENLYWALALSRWVYSYSDPTLRTVIPAPRFIVWRIRRMVKKQAYCQGMGRHTPSEVEHIAMEDLKALSDFIGRKKFLMGVNPCETDCAIFGMIACLKKMPEGSFFIKVFKDNSFPNLIAYCERMKELFWPDWVIPNWNGPTMGLQPLRP
uniref:GST N-terminal domain-containing protein n=2 Tax=Octopus bimaculoides TaxID=37653 RepID=A0A0L8FH13_OCTBM